MNASLTPMLVGVTLSVQTVLVATLVHVNLATTLGRVMTAKVSPDEPTMNNQSRWDFIKYHASNIRINSKVTI